MEVPAYNTPPAQPGQITLVGKSFASRAGSYIIDLIILNLTTLLISVVAGLVLGVVFFASGLDADMRDSTPIENILVGIPITLSYFISFEGLFCATPGKLILGMRVVKEDGSPCDFGSAVVRALFRYIDSLFFAIIAYSNMKPPLYQRLGDKSAKTVVVDRKQVTAPLPEWWMGVLAFLLFATIAFVMAIVLVVGLVRQ